MSADHVPHTYQGPCRLSPVIELPPVSQELDGIPDIQAQYFYSSPIPIDDPLSAPASTSATTSEARNAKAPLRPFSPGDNNALERAWLRLASDYQRQSHAQSLRAPSPGPGPGPGPPALASAAADKLAAVIHDLVAQHAQKHADPGAPSSRPGPGSDFPTVAVSPSNRAATDQLVCCAELLVDASAALRTEFCALARKRLPMLDLDRVVCAVMDARSRVHVDAAPPSERVETGPTLRSTSLSSPSPTSPCGFPAAQEDVGSLRRGSQRHNSAEVAVGLSRLHLVSLPVLQMKPIYWSPVNDMAVVMRATWFYRFVHSCPFFLGLLLYYWLWTSRGSAS